MARCSRRREPRQLLQLLQLLLIIPAASSHRPHRLPPPVQRRLALALAGVSRRPRFRGSQAAGAARLARCTEVPGALLDHARRAVAACPVLALRLDRAG
jgi:hypothetical protein